MLVNKSVTDSQLSVLHGYLRFIARRGRKRLQRGESSSEPDLTTAGRRPGRAGFPPGFTVDELRWYRKKKPPGDWGPRDNLKPDEGSMKKIKTEYNRCYKSFHFLPGSSEDLTTEEDPLVRMRRGRKPEDYLRLEGEHEYHPEYRELYVAYPSQRPQVPRPKAQLELEEGLMDSTSEQHGKYVPPQGQPRAQLMRRSSSLQREGEFMVKSSEMHSQFVRHDDAKRADLTRRPTSLRMEGDMAATSETAENFITYLMAQRPDLAKAPSTLKLEGPMDIQTEKREKYVPFNLQERPALAKRATNLHLEGEMETKTEKQDKFVPFNVEKRTALAKRDTNLHLEGEMDVQTEQHEKFIPYEMTSRQKITKRPTNLRLNGDLETQSEKTSKYVPFEAQKRPPLAKKDTNLQLQGDMSMTPEYKEAFIEYHTERQKPKRPVNNLGGTIDEQVKQDRRKKDDFFIEYKKPFRSFDASLRVDGTHDIRPVHKENVPHRSKKPKENSQKLEDSEGGDNLQLQGQPEMSTQDINKHASVPRKVVRPAEEISGKEVQRSRLGVGGDLGEVSAEYRSSYVDHPRERPVLRRPENSLRTEGHVSHLSEKESQYVEHELAPRPALARRDGELRMEGRLECQPEYRRAYIDYLQRENPARKPRPFDNLPIAEPKAFDVVDTATPPCQAEKPKIIVQREKQKPLKPKKPGAAEAGPSKSRSVSPDRRRKTRQVPRTPRQDRILVPDISGVSPRRPSSIFGQRTGKWYPREGSPSCRAAHLSEDEYEERLTRCCSRSCILDHIAPCSRGPSRWESPCGQQECSKRASPRLVSPSPPRRRTWSRERPPRKAEEKAASFVVLTDKVEINNNRVRDDKAYGGCCKEQKWMPPWYEPPA